jgi:hypothetical protein
VKEAPIHTFIAHQFSSIHRAWGFGIHSLFGNLVLMVIGYSNRVGWALGGTAF